MRAAILEKIGVPLTVTDIDLPTDMKRGQVLVRVLCTGICGSQLQEIDGIKGNPDHIPHMLGHEGCGIVLATGEGVTTVKEGDKCVMHWRKGDGIEAEPATYGNIKAGPITTFSEYAVVSENRVTTIPQDVPNDFAALIGCGLSTALAIIEKEVDPMEGQQIAVIGCGGVGLCLILAGNAKHARMMGIDLHESKAELVRSLGACFSTPVEFPSSFIIIDTVSNERLDSFNGKYISLQPNGTSAGGFDPVKDIPHYIEYWREGFLKDYPKVITHRISLDQINEGIQLMRDGKAGRVMIEM